MKDNLILLKESIKSKMADNFLSRRHHPAISLAQRVTRRVGAKRIEKIIDGKPKSYVIITDSAIIRIPLDRLTLERYRINKLMLKQLANTKISGLVPRFKEEGKMDNFTFFCEERLNGFALDVPISKMDEMVLKAAQFLTSFHQETVKKIVLDENNFKRLFSRDFNELSKYLTDEYKAKLAKIEEDIKKQLIGKQFVTVWQHGDYKVENVLFDTADWSMKGVIDWDLSERDGLPLLDILYLLIYKTNLLTKLGIANIFKTRFLRERFLAQEKSIIENYLKALNLNVDFIEPLLAIFWMHHIAKRYQNKLINKEPTDNEWFKENVYSVIDSILSG